MKYTFTVLDTCNSILEREDGGVTSVYDSVIRAAKALGIKRFQISDEEEITPYVLARVSSYVGDVNYLLGKRNIDICSAGLYSRFSYIPDRLYVKKLE
jgi:hypothetical protein